MSKLLVILILLASTVIETSGQINRGHLLGEWEANNKDSMYYKSDSVVFYQDINHFYDGSTCDIVVLRVSKTDFKFVNTYLCTEPGRERWLTGKHRLKLKKSDGKQILEIIVLNESERFEIINYAEKRIDHYPWDIKILKLRRLQ
jgi:hypothetical protein